MTDVERLIREAWEKHQRRILSNPHELQKRLARRRTPTLTRPPRAWCLALRASDRRITPMHWLITPEHALDLDHPDHPYEPIEHTVTIQPHGLRKFSRPVRTDSLGEQVADVAKQLGTSRRHLLHSRWAGIFTQRFIKGLGGKWGKPVPLIHSWASLDPAGTAHFAKPDSLWGGLWEFFPDMIPDDFEQTIVRKPLFRPFPIKGAPREYWDMRFRGWRWICPGCKQHVRKVYYPLPVPTLFDFLGYDAADPRRCRRAPERFLRLDVYKIDPPPPTFACSRCHRIRHLTRTDNRGWNEIVAHFTRGLLYGHEVEKPHWYKTPRQRTRIRQLHRPSPKRDAIFDRLQLGHTLDTMAVELLIPRKSVRQAIRHILAQHGVKNRRDLAKKLGWTTPQPLNGRERIRARAALHDEQIQSLLLNDTTHPKIAHRLGLTLRCVQHAVAPIFRRHNVPPKSGNQALAQKLNVPFTGRQATATEFRERLLAGQSNHEIADAMGLPLRKVQIRSKNLYKKEGVKGRKGLLEKYAQPVEAASAAV